MTSSGLGEEIALRAPDWEDKDDFRRMQDVLDTVGYTHAEVCAQLQTTDIQGASDARQYQWRRCVRGDSPKEILIRLFLLGLMGDEAEVRRALAPMSLEQWLQAGLLLRRGEQIWAAVHLLPAQGRIRLIYDFAPRGRRSTSPHPSSWWDRAARSDPCGRGSGRTSRPSSIIDGATTVARNFDAMHDGLRAAIGEGDAGDSDIFFGDAYLPLLIDGIRRNCRVCGNVPWLAVDRDLIQVGVQRFSAAVRIDQRVVGEPAQRAASTALNTFPRL